MRAFAVMLPRLQAEEQLAAIEAVGLGSGTVRKQDRNAAIERLRRRARGRARAAKATPAMLSTMGIRLVKEGAKRDA